MRKHFFAHAAGPFLAIYLLLLLGSSYVSQQSLRQASDNALLFNLEKRASALSYFHSERKNDINNLAKDHSLSAFFSHRALGMSMKYGLRASLDLLQNRFQEIVENKQLNHAPIYLRLLFLENNGNTLVDIGLSSGQPVPWENTEIGKIDRPTSLISKVNGHAYSLLIVPYFNKEKRLGTIIAEINRNEVIQYLIHTQASDNIQYSITTTDSHGSTTYENFSQQQTDTLSFLLKKSASLSEMPVPGTPFILTAQYTHKGVVGTFLMSRWYLVSLTVLSLLALHSIMIRNRAKTHALLLRKQIEEADRQNTMIQEKNRLLQEEVQKRLNSEANLQTLVETIPDLVWLKDPDGIYLACNPKFERLYGSSEKNIIGKTDYDFVDKDLADFFRKHDRAAMEAGTPLINEETVTYADDGHKECLETIKTPLLDSEGKLVGILGIARDITARKQAEDEARYLSSHDPLTSLYNRRELEKRIAEEINRATRYAHCLSIFMVDLDHFKLVNDTYGHLNGDIVLRHLAKLLLKAIRKTDYVARYGGEEFIIVLPETPLLEAKELAERLCEQIGADAIPLLRNETAHITASIGVASFPEHHKSWEGLIGTADSAMYAAKQAGRNQVKTA